MNPDRDPPDHLIRGMKAQIPWTDEENEILLNCSLEGGDQSNMRFGYYNFQNKDKVTSWDYVLFRLPGRTREDAEFHLIELRNFLRLNLKESHETPGRNRRIEPTCSRKQNRSHVYGVWQSPSQPPWSNNSMNGQADGMRNGYVSSPSKELPEMPSVQHTPEPIPKVSTRKRRKLSPTFTAAQDEKLVRLWFALKDPKQIAQELGDKNEKMVKQRKLELSGDDADLENKPRSALWQKVLKETMNGGG